MIEKYDSSIFKKKIIILKVFFGIAAPRVRNYEGDAVSVTALTAWKMWQ